MNLKELRKQKKADSSVPGKKVMDSEISLGYSNQEGSYGATFKKVKEGYQCIDNNYYHLIDTPFDASPEHFTPEVGDVLTEKQFKELREFVEETNGREAQEWWDSLDDEEKEECVLELFGDDYDINSLTMKQIEDLFTINRIF